MDKTKLVKLKGDTSVNYNGVDMGYSRDGIVLSFRIDYRKLISQRYKSPVDVKLVSSEAEVRANLYELSTANRNLIYAYNSGTDNKKELKVYGKLKDGTVVTFNFYKAYISAIGDLTLTKAPNPLSVTWTCLLNESGNLFSIT